MKGTEPQSKWPRLLVALRSRCVGTLLAGVVAALAVGPWVRPPMTSDVRGMQTPLTIDGQSAQAVDAWERDAPASISFTAPGSIVLMAVAVLVVAIWLNPNVQRVGFGALTLVCVWCFAVTVFGQPALYDALDRQLDQQTHVSLSLAEMSGQMFFPESPQRPEPIVPWESRRFLPKAESKATALNDDLFGIRIAAGSFARGLLYQRFGILVCGFAAVLTFVFARGSMSVSFVKTVGWSSGGLLLACVTLSPIARAHGLRDAASSALRELNCEQARRLLREAHDVCPALAGTRTSMDLLGEIDQRTDRNSAAAQYFVARQFLGLGKPTEAYAALSAGLATDDLDAPSRRRERLLSDLRAEAAVKCALADLQHGNFDNAAAWSHRATDECSRVDALIVMSVSQVRARSVSSDVLQARFEPLVKQLGSRTLESDLHSLQAQAFLNDRRPEEARQEYRAAYDVIRLPRYVSYYAQDALLGF